ESSKMKEVLLDEIRKLSDHTIRRLTNLQTTEDIEILRTAILRRAEKWIETGVLEADAPWENAWNLFRTCLEIHRAATDQKKPKFPHSPNDY
ncbi:MAG: hypothetical protein ACE5JU_20860, partial [Candidatus Binatia bacterium]